MKKRKNFNLIFILFFLIIVSIIVFFNILPKTKGEEAIPESIVIQFSAGDKTGTFDNLQKELITNEISGYITLPAEFANTVTVNDTAYIEKVDDETYYFNSDDYSYTFTGWKIKGETRIAPGETVFQPGDKVEAKYLISFDNDGDGIVELEALWGKVIFAQNAYTNVYYTDYWVLDLEKTKTYEKTGAWNYQLDENNQVILNDGKDINNPVCTMDYAYYLIYQMDFNNGFANASSHNAYEYVIMLTGDLDYVKTNKTGINQPNCFTAYDIYNGSYDSTKHYIFGEYPAQISVWGYVTYYQNDGGLATKSTQANANTYSPSVSFKSCRSDTTEIYNLYLNGFGYSDAIYSSIRIDNVNFAKTPNTKRPSVSNPVAQATETTFNGKENCFIEFTRRSDAGGYVFRPQAVQTVVINGGAFQSWQTTWSSNQIGTYELHWYVGENAKISGAINLGTTANYSDTAVNFTQDIYLTMTGGTVGQIYGTCNGMNSTTSGKRKITIIGDKGSSTTTNPKVTSIYGGGNTGPYYGDTNIVIKGSTNIGNVYGGGYYFTATTYGNTNIKISDSTIAGNVFGGGYNGNVEKDSSGNGGNVNLNIENSEVKGNIFGSGMGGSQTLTITLTKTADQQKIDWQNTEFVPDDEFFSSVKIEENGDCDTDWSWDKPASGFPFIQKGTNYICTAVYKNITWVSHGSTNISFQRVYTYAYLSIATVEEDVTITIDGSTIGTKGDTKKGNVYGGGSVAVVNGNTYVTVKNNSTIYGNIYGGGDGVTQPSGVDVYYPMPEEGYTAPTYTIIRNENGNVDNVKCTTESSTYKNYKYNGTFQWSDEQTLIEKGGVDTENNLIYSTNLDSLGVVNGNTNVVVENSIVEKNIYAGGNAADVLGETSIIVTNSSAKDVFGGAYSGNVGKNTIITINSGNFENIFGGGDLGVIGGNTQIIIGNSSNPNINIASLLYGGGRGIDSNGDGDASDFTTVNGTATVTIEGINTYVENYGSSTIGAVAGKIDVTFKKYWTGNSTNKYKTMNGIDRATNVYFVDSYVLLTNKDVDGNLIGIKSIENLYIPKGSGLKVSAPGEISGNFEGGGELYLDSEVCLTIRGNITGTTTLVLNPLMYTENYEIKGGTENPYMQVYGEYPEGSLQIEGGDAQALISGDSRYKIIFLRENNYTKYYIYQDIIISQTITETILLKEGKENNFDTQSWSTSNISLMQDDVITSNIKLAYQFKLDDELKNKYQNIERYLHIKSGTNSVQFPINTKITMIINTNGTNEFYKYKVAENVEEIKIKDFIQMESGTEKYVETNNIVQLSTGDTLTGIYSYNEEFQFILDFSECENYLQGNMPYNILLDTKENGESIAELTYSAVNTVNMYNKRGVNYNAEINNTNFLGNGNVILKGTMDLDLISDSTIVYNDEGKNLNIKVILKNSSDDIINIPTGTTIRINDTEYKQIKDTVSYTLLEITRHTVSENLKIEFDMSSVLKENRLQPGIYNIEVLSYTENGNIINKKIGSNIFEFNIIDGMEYGIKSKIINNNENEDEFKLFSNESNTLQIDILKGNLQNPYITIELQKRNSPFTYSNIENTITQNKIQSNDLLDSNIVDINNNLEAGTYRFVIILYDIYNIKYAEDIINFIDK